MSEPKVYLKVGKGEARIAGEALPVQHVKKSKLWVATCQHDPNTKGGVVRKFWDKHEGVFRGNGVALGDILEFGGDFFAGKGAVKNRSYSIVEKDGDGDLFVQHFKRTPLDAFMLSGEEHFTKDEWVKLSLVPNIEHALAVAAGHLEGGLDEAARILAMCTEEAQAIAKM